LVSTSRRSPARAGDRREELVSARLRGEDIAFTLNITLEGFGLTQHEFSGKVNGDEIIGNVKLSSTQLAAITLPWRARRTTEPRYFAPTGTALFKPPSPLPVP
jgi:hypothetical protein